MTGIEPALREEPDLKSGVSAVPPHRLVGVYILQAQ